MAKIFDGLAGLALFSGSSKVLDQYYQAVAQGDGNFQSATVRKARALFKTPPSTPPWKEKGAKEADPGKLSTVRAMRTIIDADRTSQSKDPDVTASIITYKALDRLQILAEAAAKPGLSEAERASLARSFDKGLRDLQSYMSGATLDKLRLLFGELSSHTESNKLGGDVNSFTGQTRVLARSADGLLQGVSGSERIEITLGNRDGKGRTDTVTLDLSTLGQPPRLGEVVKALNAKIGSIALTTSDGSPLLDGAGRPIPRWGAQFTLELVGEDQWAIGYRLPANETVRLGQAGAPDSIMVVSAQTDDNGTTMAMRRVDNPQDETANARPLDRIGAIDRDATAREAAKNDEAKRPKGPDGKPLPPPDPTKLADLDVRAMATDASGSSYVVGTTDGDFGAYRSTGKTTLFVTKLDSAGHVLWQHPLGEPGTSTGGAISVDAAGTVTVSGTVSGDRDRTVSMDDDMVVARFTASGQKIFSTAIRSGGDDSATAVTVGADGSIYVGGQTSRDGVRQNFVFQIDAGGNLRQRATLATDTGGTIKALAVDPRSGALLALTRDDASAVLRTLDPATITEQAQFDLGAVDARALAVSSEGRVAVAGATTGTAVAGAQANGLTGGRDAFVTQLDATLANARTSYVGGGGDDQADSVAFIGDAIVIGGRTKGDLAGTRTGKVDGFTARIALDSGAVGAIAQFGTYEESVGPVLVGRVPGPGSALQALGLPSGDLGGVEAPDLASQTGLHGKDEAIGAAGDRFQLRLNDMPAFTVEIDKDETIRTLADKIKRKLGKAVTVTAPVVEGRATLKISVTPGNSLKIMPGPQDQDALPRLGLEAGTLISDKPPAKDEPKVKPGGKFALSLTTTLSLASREQAKTAVDAIKQAIARVQGAYSSLYWSPAKAALLDKTQGQPIDARTQKQIDSYRSALTRLGG
ncbi:hypothetical protein [Sphingomonas morindae]|uniref:Regulatory protein FlaEY n=1 Tax=Sphingomonas morindae TaxID=1541170 RepID=A0ABY4X8P5_9SPHN|nr:hypothetical protein [Sphingomonas morindae]USI73270.1 hypothetical protein LHA26_01970 [Sphingomonas morindae]